MLGVFRHFIDINNIVINQLANGKDETRLVFRNMETGSFQFLYFLFYIVFVIEVLLFFYVMYKLFRKYAQGEKDPIKRIKGPQTLFSVIKGFFFWSSHDNIDKTDYKIKWAHRLMLLGFFILLLGTIIVTFNQEFLITILGMEAPAWFYGYFYLFFSFIMDLATLIAVLAIFYFLIRRYKLPKRLDYTRSDKRELNPARKKWVKEDAFFLVYVLGILFVGLFLESIRIVADELPDYERFSFLGYIFAIIFHSIGLNSGIFIEDLYVVTWWLHLAQVFFFFTVVIPYTKGLHMITSYLSIITSDPLAARRLPKSLTDNSEFGYKTIQDFSWRDLISFDACTKCGRCHISCPAQTVGQPLSPRDLILDLREQAAITLGSPEYSFRTETRKSRTVDQNLIGSTAEAPILESTIWSCTTCLACMQMCPVGIEHIPLIVQLRRGLIDKGELNLNIQDTLEKIERYGNSFGEPEGERPVWTSELRFRMKDVREEYAEYLWFVGDYASYNTEARKRTILIAEILNLLEIDVGILYEDERNAGNDVRRIGEEGLFEDLVDQNMEIMQESKFSKIITADPHTYNTLKNEYPDYGLKQPVYHIVEVINNLIQEKGIIIKNPLNYTVTYHDPCYLGRYNEVYEAPRGILKATGVILKEMPRNRSNTFCCGAGGGRIWQEDVKIEERPSVNRINEAVSLGNIDFFAVSCPKDLVMFSDAIKSTQKEDKMQVKDIFELLAESLGLIKKEIVVNV